MVRGGLELVLGLHRDREMGLIVMAGGGGVLLELAKDVAFCAPPVSREKAQDLLDRTHAGRLIRGYRGSAPRDADAVPGRPGRAGPIGHRPAPTSSSPSTSTRSWRSRRAAWRSMP